MKSQQSGLSLFWSHDLDQLQDFIRLTREA